VTLLLRVARSAAALLCVIATAGLGSAAVPAPAQAQTGTTLINETFTHAEAPDFTGYNEACLTGAPGITGEEEHQAHILGGCEDTEYGPVPPLNAAGHGYLRLTDAGLDRTAAALYNHPLPASAGLDVTFDVWQYGSTVPQYPPADGVSFFLTDGEANLTAPGQFGGSLGYAQKKPGGGPPVDIQPGVEDGYLGVGLDVLGNYFGDREQRGNGCEAPYHSPARAPDSNVDANERGPNMVTVRGPGNGTEGYCYITATSDDAHSTTPSEKPWLSNLPGELQGSLEAFEEQPVTPESAERELEPSRRRVNVRLTPAPNPRLVVTVDFNDGDGPQEVLDVAAPTPVPDTYKFGFAASTGAATDVHLIRNVTVASDEPLAEQPALGLVKHADTASFAQVGDPIHYTFTVTNDGNVEVTNVQVRDDLFPGGVACEIASIPVGEERECEATHYATEEDVRDGRVANTAHAHGDTPAGGTTDSLPDSQDVQLAEQPGIRVDKSAEPPSFNRAGQVIRYSYRVRNTGNVRLSRIRVRDSRLGDVPCPRDTLEPGDSMTCTASHRVTAADVERGYVSNTATVTGTTASGTEIREQSTKTLPFTGVRPAPARPARVPPITRVPVRVTG
jgi:uncharacterized repeat protein (TIGR01451 family)